MSKLAQAGESSTASPARASREARSTASSRLAQCSFGTPVAALQGSYERGATYGVELGFEF